MADLLTIQTFLRNLRNLIFVSALNNLLIRPVE